MLVRLRTGIARVDVSGIATASFLAACLMLGGGTRPGFLSDAVLQFAAIPLLLVGVWQYLDTQPTERSRAVVILLAAILAVPALQLVPLPPAVWTLLPGRQLVTETMQVNGNDLPWAPMSVSPRSTWLSLLSLLPPFAVFLAVAQSNVRQRRDLSLVILFVVALSVAVGLTQLFQGQNSSLRFYTVTNSTDAVGFFANRNHFAALLYATIPLTAAWALHALSALMTGTKAQRFEAGVLLPALGAFLLLVALIAGVVAARSRAGIGLAMLALLASLALAATDRRALGETPHIKLLLGSAIAFGLFIAQFALYRVFDRFTSDPLADARIPFSRNTAEAAWAYFPFGSGMGTFIPVYASFEKSADVLAETFANRAHNDILEVWLEAGLLGAAVAILCAAWLIPRAVAVWRQRMGGLRGIDGAIARAASLSLPLLLVHSLFDYPLRTCAIMTLVAFACGLLVAPVVTARDHEADLDEGLEARSTSRARVPWPEATAMPHGAASDPAQARPVAGGQRWGKGVEWPDAWRSPDDDLTAPPGGRPPPKGSRGAE